MAEDDPRNDPREYSKDWVSAICAAFRLPKHIIEHSTAVDALFIEARALGIPRVDVQRIYDEEMERTKASRASSSDALSETRRRVITEKLARHD